MVIARFLGCALAAAALASCSDPDPLIETRYGAYEGDAYPDRRPEIAIPDGGMGVVTDSLSETISLIALETGERFGVRPVGRDPVTIDGPHRVVVDAAGGALYIATRPPPARAAPTRCTAGARWPAMSRSSRSTTCASSGRRASSPTRATSRSRRTAGAWSSLISISSARSIGAPYFSAWAPDGSAIYVPTQVPDTIARSGMAPDDSGAVSRNISAECPRPHLAELDQEHGLFIVCEGDQTVTPGKVLRPDPETLETRSEAEVGLFPDALARVGAGAR
ncbi:hypothetical protein [Sorangium sp. So ce887]|uniref:hypothetical protein n=1 Tax=Sorangium sp. So ce887 TaxID=3133324 RepID=UPI003F5F9CAF